MGCDIHGIIEVRDSDMWWGVANVGTMVRRNYNLFGLLAGVRHDHVEDPIAEGRGLPDGISERTQEKLRPFLDWHQTVTFTKPYPETEFVDVSERKYDDEPVQRETFGPFEEGNTYELPKYVVSRLDRRYYDREDKYATYEVDEIVDCHDVTYITLAEIQDIDWDQTLGEGGKVIMARDDSGRRHALSPEFYLDGDEIEQVKDGDTIEKDGFTFTYETRRWKHARTTGFEAMVDTMKAQCRLADDNDPSNVRAVIWFDN